MSVSRDDPYRILQVDASASPLVIQAAYRTLAQIFHPDVGGDPEVMKRINAAWEILRDPVRRRQHDEQLLRAHLAASNAAGTDGTGWETPRSVTPVFARSHIDHAGPPRGPAFGPVLTFGRYEGWTLGQVAGYDRRFLEWLRRVPAGRALRSEIDAVLQARGAPMFGYRRRPEEPVRVGAR